MASGPPGGFHNNPAGGGGGGGPMAGGNKSISRGPPRGYVPGLGRGAAGFTTRSDVGPAAAMPAPGADGGGEEGAGAGGGSRASEARAKLKASQQQQQGGGGGGGEYDRFGGYSRDKPFVDGQYANDDDEADKIWAAIDERLQNKRKKKRKKNDAGVADTQATGGGGEEDEDPRTRISAPFRELKAGLADVTEDEWAAIPDNAGDASLRYKQSQQKQRQDVFTPLTDSLLEQRSLLHTDATAGSNNALAGTATASSDGTETATASATTVVNMAGLSAARGTVLGMSLDKMSDNVAGQTTVDPQGYLTQMASTAVSSSSATNIADVNKARLLLQSVRDTNPKHGPAWIAAARVEEAAGKLPQARAIIQQACQVCGDNNADVWLEAARLHPTPVAKSILATAVRRLPQSVKLFVKAAELEATVQAKRAVLRKALEANPTSVQLWKAAIALEDADNARLLLGVAVEKIPQCVDMWLALARLESYDNAQKVLNQARKALPSERSVWMAAAKLEEGQQRESNVKAIVKRAVSSLRKNDAVVTRAQWLQEAEHAEAAGAPLTGVAIVEQTIGQDVDDEDRVRTWSDDAQQALARGAVATARAIVSQALAAFPTKRSFWMQAVDLEKQHGTAQTLDEVLAAASERLPRVELFWLLRAKEQWLGGSVDKSREILAQAFAANPDSEAVWLAAAKLEWETGEAERASVLLQRARERAPTARVYMKSALFEREQRHWEAALELIEAGIAKYPKFAKLYMMGGQICSDDLPKVKSSLDRARKFYQRGLQRCPTNTVLWTLASQLEERASTFESSSKNNSKPSSSTASAATTTGNATHTTKARALLDLGRLKNLQNPELWLESVRLERRVGNYKLADTLLAKALQECPASGLLLAESIRTAPRVEQKSKSAHAIKKCPDDPRVIVAVASLFASERKHDKARKWMDRAVVLNPDFGDSWARYYAFELVAGKKEQLQTVKDRCVAADPKHGEIWQSVTKDLANRGKAVGEFIEVAAQKVQAEQKEQQQANGQLAN